MRTFSALACSSLLVVSLAGCHVTTHKDGKDGNVDIGTPFGSMSVKTNDNVSTAGLGITPYPGATMLKKGAGGDSDAADVNLNFGSFHLGVKAVKYLTTDSPDKVLAYYRNDLKKFGVVLQCDGNKAVGQPTRTAEGLTCDYDTHKNAHVTWIDNEGEATELRTGSRQRQHIVSIEPKDGGTRIGLVALDLPGNISTRVDDKDTE